MSIRALSKLVGIRNVRMGSVIKPGAVAVAVAALITAGALPATAAEEVIPSDESAIQTLISERAAVDNEQPALDALTAEVVHDVSVLNSCNSPMNAVAFTGQWMESTKFDCSIAGDSTSRIGYSWQIDPNAVGGSICFQGRGARIPASNPYVGGQLYWHSGGCGSSGSVTVDWQSSLHHKAARFSAANAPVLGVGFNWT